VASGLRCNGFCSGVKAGSNMEPHQHCETNYKQVFDTSLVDRISNHDCSDGHVGIYKDTVAGEIKFYISVTDWPHPHQPVTSYCIIATLPLITTLDEVTSFKIKLEGELEFPAPSFHSKEQVDNERDGMELDAFVNFDTDVIVCYGCASKHSGVVYSHHLRY
jgi:hypothetical protein